METEENKAICLECNKEFLQDRDLQICDDCINLFDSDELWRLHDLNKLDALDFNENRNLRERFRITEKKTKMEITEFKAEQKYKKELAEGTINTGTTPHYNSFKDYCEMLKDMGYKISKA